MSVAMPLMVGMAVGTLFRYITGWPTPVSEVDAVLLSVIVIFGVVLERRADGRFRRHLLDIIEGRA